LSWIIRVMLKSGKEIKVDNIHLHRSGGTLFLFSQNAFLQVKVSEIKKIEIIQGEQNINRK